MANQEHVQILESGAGAWNRWSDGHPGVTGDFNNARFHGLDFRSANLRGADFRNAILWSGNFMDSDLREADFSKVNLGRADFRRADLSGATLRGAELKETNFFEANLRGTDLTDCVMGHTVLGIDLSGVKGLETVRHCEASALSMDTLYNSRGSIPDVFLRGCGVPEFFIANLRSLLAAVAPIEFYSCFISYSHKDQTFAERLHNDLQANGVRCWFAPKDLKTGDIFRQRIDEAIRLNDRVLIVLSESSVESSWVQKEVETVFEKEMANQQKTLLFPIRLDAAVMRTSRAWAADIRRMRHIADFSNWKNPENYREALKRLLTDLHSGSPPEPYSMNSSRQKLNAWRHEIYPDLLGVPKVIRNP